MLTLTKKTDYALIALMHLAKGTEGSVSAREIADQHGVPLPLLMNILKTLTQEGLIKSVRGPKGGYLLALRASEITLDRLIGAIEGPIRFVQCSEMGSVQGRLTCELVDTCPVRSPALRIHNRIKEFLSGMTLAEFAEASDLPRPLRVAETLELRS